MIIVPQNYAVSTIDT